jgi:hypothetical protein
MPEIYVSTDVEADGPIPGPHSMLSFASAAFLANKTLLSTFAANWRRCPARRLNRRLWTSGRRSLRKSSCPGMCPG